jgi:predicted Zn-dependent protease
MKLTFSHKLKSLFRKPVIVAASISAMVLLSACATSPTGRNQLILYPSAQLDAMGQQAFSGLKSDLKISNKTVTNNLVQCIAQKITAQVPDTVFSGEWEVVVFDDPQVNAFALPGGKIGVYTGLLTVAENQHQIASVIGHEVGHVIAQHGNERLSNTAFAGITQQVAGQVLAANEVAQTPTIMRALGVGLQLGTLKYSRDHESEADVIGLDLMAKAGFKPQGAVELWKNMASQAGQRPPEFLSTHPAESTRIDNLNRNMAAANAIYEKARAANCS